MGPEVSDQSVRELAQVFKLLSDETRLRILFYLALSPQGELHVTDLCQRLGQSQPAVSHHLALAPRLGADRVAPRGQAQLLLRPDRPLRRVAPEPVLGGRRGPPEQEVPLPRFHAHATPESESADRAMRQSRDLAAIRCPASCRPSDGPGLPSRSGDSRCRCDPLTSSLNAKTPDAGLGHRLLSR